LLKIFSMILLMATLSNAGWMFVNDDGSLSPYNQEEELYTIPQEIEIPKKKITIKKHKKQHKRKKPKIHITSKPINQYAQKTMYLTFDDGPLNGTENVISVLRETATPATMFMIGKHIDANDYREDLFLTAIDEPNIFVANHTYNHANGHYRKFYSNAANVVNDLSKMEEKLLTYDAYHSFKCCRLAGRNVFRLDSIKRNDPAIRRKKEYDSYNALADNGYKIIGWDCEYSYNPKNGNPYKSPQAMVRYIEKIYQRQRTKKANKLILLMHDFEFKDRFNGKEKLRTLISLLQDKGWSFETLETY